MISGIWAKLKGFFGFIKKEEETMDFSFISKWVSDIEAEMTAIEPKLDNMLKTATKLASLVVTVGKFIPGAGDVVQGALMASSIASVASTAIETHEAAGSTVSSAVQALATIANAVATTPGVIPDQATAAKIQSVTAQVVAATNAIDPAIQAGMNGA